MVFSLNTRRFFGGNPMVDDDYGDDAVAAAFVSLHQRTTPAAP